MPTDLISQYRHAVPSAIICAWTFLLGIRVFVCLHLMLCTWLKILSYVACEPFSEKMRLSDRVPYASRTVAYRHMAGLVKESWSFRRASSRKHDPYCGKWWLQGQSFPCLRLMSCSIHRRRKVNTPMIYIWCQPSQVSFFCCIFWLGDYLPRQSWCGAVWFCVCRLQPSSNRSAIRWWELPQRILFEIEIEICLRFLKCVLNLYQRF